MLEPIVRRVRERPAMTLDEHLRMIEKEFKDPWWKDTPTPNVIYGSAGQFEKAIHKELRPRFSYERTDELDRWDDKVHRGGVAEWVESGAGTDDPNWMRDLDHDV